MTIDEQLKDLPTRFPVAVIMQRTPSAVSVWSDCQWNAVGIAVVQTQAIETEDPQLVHEQGDTRQYLFNGFDVSLYLDECESYYHNLISPTPRCYIVTRQDENDVPVPFQVSMSFDEAHAYQECDEEVYAVDIPPELYRWVEAYVLANYVATKRKKRKRQDWKNQHANGGRG
jgi:hypothetical protein